MQENTIEQTDHSLLASPFTLAFALNKFDRNEEALQLRNHIIRMYQIILGDTHLDQLAAEYALALNYINMKEEGKAIEIVRHVVKIGRSALESANPLRVKSETLLKSLEDGTMCD